MQLFPCAYKDHRCLLSGTVKLELLQHSPDFKLVPRTRLSTRTLKRASLNSDNHIYHSTSLPTMTTNEERFQSGATGGDRDQPGPSIMMANASEAHELTATGPRRSQRLADVALQEEDRALVWQPQSYDAKLDTPLFKQKIRELRHAVEARGVNTCWIEENVITFAIAKDRDN